MEVNIAFSKGKSYLKNLLDIFEGLPYVRARAVWLIHCTWVSKSIDSW